MAIPKQSPDVTNRCHRINRHIGWRLSSSNLRSSSMVSWSSRSRKLVIANLYDNPWIDTNHDTSSSRCCISPLCITQISQRAGIVINVGDEMVQPWELQKKVRHHNPCKCHIIWTFYDSINVCFSYVTHVKLIRKCEGGYDLSHAQQINLKKKSQWLFVY